jgi:homeobox protein ESX1
MNDSLFSAIMRRRQIIRAILFTIIVATLPFYCAGFLLWGTARLPGAAPETIATNTPIGADGPAIPTGLPSTTPLPLTATLLSPLQPTPLQFIPINRPPTTATPFIAPTLFLPTTTLAPTLTFQPTFTPVLLTSTPPDVPTNPPPATAVPTQPPLPTEVPPTIAPAPTETPIPFDTEVPPPPPVPPTAEATPEGGV